jgi:hypothetical protein
VVHRQCNSGRSDATERNDLQPLEREAPLGCPGDVCILTSDCAGAASALQGVTFDTSNGDDMSETHRRVQDARGIECQYDQHCACP